MRFKKLSLSIAIGACLTTGVAANAAVHVFTVVGGASGMTTDLNPHATLVRGCAPRVMDSALLAKRTNPDSGTVKHVYCKARIKGNDSYGEPNASGTWTPSSIMKFTGDNKDCEIEFCKMENGDIWYAVVIRADSVLGMRYVVNKNYIYKFDKCSGNTNS